MAAGASKFALNHHHSTSARGVAHCRSRGQEALAIPARIIEELASRKKEKIATFLTFESIVAVLICFMPIFIISGSWPLLTRVPLCLAAAVAGYVCTLEFQGLPLYEHALWTVRGIYRLRLHGDHVGPEDLPGATPTQDQDRVIAASGPITVARRTIPAALQPALLETSYSSQCEPSVPLVEELSAPSEGEQVGSSHEEPSASLPSDFQEPVPLSRSFASSPPGLVVTAGSSEGA